MKRLVTQDLIEALALSPSPGLTGEWPAERMNALIDAAAGGHRLPVFGLPVWRSQKRSCRDNSVSFSPLVPLAHR